MGVEGKGEKTMHRGESRNLMILFLDAAPVCSNTEVLQSYKGPKVVCQP